MGFKCSRREILTRAAGVTGGALAAGAAAKAYAAEGPGETHPPAYCLNTGTIRGQNLTLDKEIEVAAKAGYQGIEPWVGSIDQYARAGGSLKDLAKRLGDLGLSVESAISFFEWIVDDDERRAKALERAKRDMDLVARIGGKRIAAPPAGATGQAVDLLRAADRYRVLLELGGQMGVVPQLEIWGASKTLARLGEAAMVAMESGHPKACLLPDVFHMYKGGSSFEGLRLLSGGAIHVFHLNDYPATPPLDKITDGDRVYPGDGVAPLRAILRSLRDIGFRGMLSLELFNRDCWKLDALTVASTGLEKMKAVVRKSLA